MGAGARRVRKVVLVATVALMASCSGHRTATPTTVASDQTLLTSTSSTEAPAGTTTTSTTTPDPVPGPIDVYAQPGWVAAENRREGTDDWRIVGDPIDPIRDTPLAWIEGYADTTSAQPGQTVTLFVDTPAASFHVGAFRMGWYGGAQGRLVWQSQATPGGRQPEAVFDSSTGTAEARWAPSLSFVITDEWPPGAYLLKLVSDSGGAHYVPLTIRRDSAAGDLVFMSAVTTWQAYNPWGGCTLYECFEPRTKFRATVVSFDRPYAHSYAQGAADFPSHELPLISFIEQQGLDVAYITNIDLHREPALGASRAGLVSPGHDEYYSWPMREALVGALDHGTNIAFFGANAVYRNIRFEPAGSGVADRRMANYRKNDPGSQDDRRLVTVNWREPPLQLPESEIVGIQYGCAEVRADMRLVNTGSWIYGGTGARDGQRLDNLVGVEFDELASGSRTPPGLEVLAASMLECRNLTWQQVTAYHTVASGAGVFAAGTIDWNCGLDGSCPGVPRFDIVRGVTTNVLNAFAAGPAGLVHPSTANARRYRVPVHEPTDPPPVPSTTTTSTEPTTTEPTTTTTTTTTAAPSTEL